MLQKFPFGIWNYTPVERSKLSDIDDWAECGLTVTMAPTIEYGKHDPRELLPFLDKAHERDMALIVNVRGLDYAFCATDGEAAYEAALREIYNSLAGHPALYGFVVGDEPRTAEHLEASVSCMRIQRKIDARLHPYLNLSGGTVGFDSELFGGRNMTEWMRYAKKESGCAVFCFDEYSQVINDGGISIYFDTLGSFTSAADASAVELWGCMLSSAHLMFKKPTEFQYIWQITVSAALGCRGIVWFRFYDRDVAPDLYGSPIDEFGYKTDAFYHMLRAQRRFNMHYGELLMRLRHKKAYLVRNMYGENVARPRYAFLENGTHPYILDAECFDEGLISFFEDEDGHEYAAFVNLSQTNYGNIRPTLDSEHCSLTELHFNGERETPFGVDTRGFGFDGNIELQPGQLRMFRLDVK